MSLLSNIEPNISQYTFEVEHFTYHHDDKVQPTPGVGEVLDEAEGEPLNHHLHGEYHSEDPVHIVEDVLQHRPLSQVNILGRLKK